MPRGGRYRMASVRGVGIMPFHAERYPPDWKDISLRIRERAGGKCEFCGAENYQLHPVTGSRVVLTVAHLDHVESNCSDDNLRALCQRCHLTYDAKHHARNAATTRHKKKLESGQLELLERTNGNIVGNSSGVLEERIFKWT